MPEYLAPGVYVEEVDTGPKPIEGVSTSTSGMVGLTERGPVNVPTLVTGVAEFALTFGGYLDRRVFAGETWYLPHAVAGFFNNSGRRLYVVRVLPATATSAEGFLFNRRLAAGAASRLAAPALRDATALLLESGAAIADDDFLRLDDAQLTEYLQADLPAAPALPNRGARALRAPLYFAHAGGPASPVEVVPMAAVVAPNNLSTTLGADVAPGETRIVLASRTNVGPGDVLRVGGGGAATREFATVASVPADPADLGVTLRHALAFAHPSGQAVEIVAEGAATASTQLNQNANPGSAVLILDDLGGGGANFDPGDVVRVGTAGAADSEYHVLADLRAVGNRVPVAFALRGPAYDDHSIAQPVQEVTFADAIAPNDFSQPLARPARAGDTSVVLSSRGDLAPNQPVRIGAGATQEFLLIASVPADALDTSVTLNQPLAFDHPGTGILATSDSVVRQTRTLGANSTTTTQALRRGDSLLLLADAAGFAANALVEIGPAGTQAVEYQTLGNAVDLEVIGVSGLAGMTPGGGLALDHPHGAAIAERATLLRVQAIDAGSWGNCLRLRVDDDRPTLETTVATANPNPADVSLALASTVGVEVGTVLDVDFPGGTAPRKVVGTAGNVVTLSASHGAAVPAGTRLRTREFLVTVECVQINPANGKPRVVASETHRGLSMDPRHSRYVTKVLGAIFRTEATTPRRADGRTEGESDLIRVEDVLADVGTGQLSGAARLAAETTIRLGPDLILQTLPDGRRVAVGRPLVGGDDRIGDVSDATFIGADAVNPRDRQGLYALKNVEEISIVAIPGRTSQRVQQELITHCELMRYRFAVLDSRVGDGVAEVQEHRGLFDSRYAAIYYPWLRIDDPFPENPRVPSQVSIPPSGHVIGIFARSDNERGVHKAPANEVIRTINDLEVKLTKEEQDILNPRNINVLRNFRDNNRGLRVWGARTVSSDPDWRYVNVRRLFIFIEHSIDRGTQWVVFEPNAEPLWERVRRVVSSFLTAVWRDGALMGRTAEEAYFVKADRTTMTQSDIDNGRLIIQVGIAPVKPAEFVIFRIGQWAGGSELAEG